MKKHLFLSFPIRTLTVGTGISPVQPHMRVMDFTIGREFHPAPKTLFICYEYTLYQFCDLVKIQDNLFLR